MTMNTPYLSTPSESTTVLSDLSISGTLDVGAADVVGTVDCADVTASASIQAGTTITAGSTLDAGTVITGETITALKQFSITTAGTALAVAGSIPLSFLTSADDNDLTIGQLVLVQYASGLSLLYSSGASVYELAESSVSYAQPTS